MQQQDPRPPPINPSLLDARVKPLVPRKSESTSSSKVDSQKPTKVPPQQQPKTGIIQTDPSDKPKTRSGESVDRQPLSNRKQETGSKTDKPTSDSPAGHPKNSPETGKRSDSVNSKEKNHPGLVIGIILTVAGCSIVSFLVGKGITEQDFRERLAKSNQSISQLTNELHTVTTALSLTTKRLERKTKEWESERVSFTNTIAALRSDLRRSEESDPFRLRVDEDEKPILLLRASIPGQTSVSATMDWNGRTAKLPVRIRNLEPGQYLPARTVSTVFGGSSYSGEMPALTVNWTGEKSLLVQLRKDTSRFSGSDYQREWSEELERQMKRSERDVKAQEKRIFGRHLGEEEKESSFWSHLWPF